MSSYTTLNVQPMSHEIRTIKFAVVLSSAERSETSHDRGSIIEGPLTLSEVLCRVGHSWWGKVEICNDGQGPTGAARRESAYTTIKVVTLLRPV